MTISPSLITLEIIVIVFGLAQVLIPILSIIRMFKLKDPSRVLYYFFFISLLLSYFSFVYGFLIVSLPIICINIISFLANFTYSVCYIVCSQNEKQTKSIKLIFLLTGICILIGISYLCLALTNFAYGIAASIINCILFLTPFQNVSLMIKEHDHTYMQIEILIVMFCNALSLIGNGLTQHYNYYFIIPNAIGCFILIAQMILWCYYYISKANNINVQKLSSNKDYLDENKPIFSHDDNADRSSYLTFEDSADE